MSEDILQEYYESIKGLISQNLVQEAKEELTSLLYNFPDESKGYYLLGVCAFVERDYDNAIFNYKKAIEIDPNNAKAYFNLGVCYHISKDYDETLVNIAKALIIFSNQEDEESKQKCISALKTIEAERQA